MQSPKPTMVDGVWYDLDPPAHVGDKVFRRVLCEYQVPGTSNEFSVRGVPDGGDQEEAFILMFTPTGSVRPYVSSNQAKMRIVRPKS